MALFRHDRLLTPSWDFVRVSINLLREHIWQVFYLSFLPGLAASVGLVLCANIVRPDKSIVFDTHAQVGVALFVAGLIWTVLVYPGLITLQLEAVRGKNPSAMECFRRGAPRILPVMGLVLLEIPLLALGFVALIFPGLVLLRGFYLAQYYVVDKKLGPVAALKQSYSDSKPVAGYIWGIVGVTMVFGMMGSAIARIPVIGKIGNLAVGLLYSFAPALRYLEIVRTAPAKASTVAKP